MDCVKKIAPYSIFVTFIFILSLLRQYVQACSWNVSNYEIGLSYKLMLQIGLDTLYFVFVCLFWTLLMDVLIRFHSSMKVSIIYAIQWLQVKNEYIELKREVVKVKGLLDDNVKKILDNGMKIKDFSGDIQKCVTGFEKVDSRMLAASGEMKIEKKKILKEIKQNVVKSFKEFLSSLTVFVLIALIFILKENKMNFTFDYLVIKNTSLHLLLLLFVIELLLCVDFFFKNRKKKLSVILGNTKLYSPPKKNIKELFLNIPNYFTIEFVRKNFLLIFFCLIILIFQTILPAFFPKAVKTFQIVKKDDNTQYAVVYMSGDKFYCKKIEIEGNDAIIYVNDQYIANSQLSSFERTFKNIEIVKEGDNEF